MLRLVVVSPLTSQKSCFHRQFCSSRENRKPSLQHFYYYLVRKKGLPQPLFSCWAPCHLTNTRRSHVGRDNRSESAAFM